MSRFLIVSAFLGAVAVVALGFALPAGPAAANGPPIRIGPGDLPPEVVTDVNPCTGLEHELTFTPTEGFIHQFESPGGPNGGHHMVMWLNGTITTSDGFSGRLGPFVLVDNGDGPLPPPGGPPAETHGVFTNVGNQMITNADGDRIRAHVNFHLTIVDGFPVVVFENFVVECVGNDG